MSSVPRKWTEALAKARALVVQDRQVHADLRERQLQFLFADAPVIKRVLALLPGTYTLRHSYLRELHDDMGAVGPENDHSVYACDAERAVAIFDDHWQAGLLGTVTVYETEAEYRAALRACDDDLDSVRDDPEVTDILE